MAVSVSVPSWPTGGSLQQAINNAEEDLSAGMASIRVGLQPLDPPGNRGRQRPQITHPEAVILNLRAHRKDGWRMAIKEWTEGSRACKTPLKDWPSAWYTGAMGTINGVKYHQRQLVYAEFERYLFIAGFLSSERPN